MSTELWSPATRPDSQGGVWQYLSPSRLNLWLKCPLAFKLKYIDGIRLPTTVNLFLGKIVHAGLECAYRSRMLGADWQPDEVVSHIDAIWTEAACNEGIVFASPAEQQTLHRQAADLVTCYLNQVPEDEPRPLAVEVTAEAPLVDPANAEELGIPLLGIMDLVLDGPKGPVVIDFKTAARNSPPLAITHEIQLTAYAYLWRQYWGRPEAGLEIHSLIKTRVPQVKVHRYPPRTDVDFARFFAVVRQYLDALDRGRYCFRPHFGCAMCEVRESHCRDWAGDAT